jgi:hypothetical protein
MQIDLRGLNGVAEKARAQTARRNAALPRLLSRPSGTIRTACGGRLGNGYHHEARCTRRKAARPTVEEKVNEVVERLVRADVGRLLRNEYPGKAICVDCLAAAIPAGSPPFTRIEIRRAVREMTDSPGFAGLPALIPLPPLPGGTGVPRVQHCDVGGQIGFADWSDRLAPGSDQKLGTSSLRIVPLHG